MNLVDVQLMLDLCVQQVSGDVFRVYPQKGFEPDFLSLQAEGYFDALRHYAMREQNV